MTTREKILKVISGELVDQIPFTPRLDLWWNANTATDTLPAKYKGKTADEIASAEGWALHKILPEFSHPPTPEDYIHQGLGLYRLKETPYRFIFPSDVDIEVSYEDNAEEHMVHVVYHTPVGAVKVAHGQTTEMKKAGASLSWAKEHAIKGPQDYKVLAHIFGNMKLEPDYALFEQWQNKIGGNGLCAALGLGNGCTSPMHYIQKSFLDATDFFLHYNDYPGEMAMLTEALENYYQQIIPILAQSPAKVIYWSGNVDDMITYPAYYEKDLMPWCLRFSEAMHKADKLFLMHTDGENLKLMDLIANSGVDICEAVAPAPMTKVSLAEYYDKWCRQAKMTLWGGIPESILLAKSASDEDFNAYLDMLFKAVAPGNYYIAGIGDTVPPAAEFDRIVRMGERFAKEGRLPLAAGGLNPQTAATMAKAAEKTSESKTSDDSAYETLKELLLNGDSPGLQKAVQELLAKNYNAQDILNKGMLSAMEVIGERFKDGSVFIPDVLLSARALNETLPILEPHLAGGSAASAGKVLVGTVKGDLHDIGKNMVATMLKGVGFDMNDLGINVSVETFVNEVRKHKPQILGISALLTTTMPQMKLVIDALKKEGLRDSVKIVVGGAPVNQKYADEIGADGYAADAGDAISVCKRLVS